MTQLRVVMLGSGFALLVTIAVIVLAGYYENLPMLVSGQAPLIFFPTLLPFLVLAAQIRTSPLVFAVIAAPLVLGWSFVAYVDSRPYEGGGASMVVMAGWAACALSTLVAILALIAAALFKWRSR